MLEKTNVAPLGGQEGCRIEESSDIQELAIFLVHFSTDRSIDWFVTKCKFLQSTSPWLYISSPCFTASFLHIHFSFFCLCAPSFSLSQFLLLLHLFSLNSYFSLSHSLSIFLTISVSLSLISIFSLLL